MALNGLPVQFGRELRFEEKLAERIAKVISEKIRGCHRSFTMGDSLLLLVITSIENKKMQERRVLITQAFYEHSF